MIDPMRLSRFLYGALGKLGVWRRRSRTPISSAQMGRPHEFFRTGVQYYVHGRHALLCGHESVAGSLFHQGFEVMFKAALLRPLFDHDSPGWDPDIPQPQRTAAVLAYTKRAKKLLARKLGHDLNKAWRRFKRLYPATKLDEFDQVVRDLHRWWSLRYPGFPEGSALEIRTNIVCPAHPATRKPAPGDPYELCLECMDRLFEAIARLDYSLNTLQFAIDGRARTGLGAETYQRENRHRIW